MSELVNLSKRVVNLENFKDVIKTEFSSFTSEYYGEVPEPLQDRIESFFAEYENLYYSIPMYGEFNSHEYLAKKSSEMLGMDVETEEISRLLQEIESLRTQLMQAYS